METFHRDQLNKLCSSQETYKKAQSILRLANAKTRPGSGFVIKNPAAITAACAYLASEQLNTGEVSLKSAMAAACTSQAGFNDILKKLGVALGTDEGGASANVTYEGLVNAYHIHPREDTIACMEDAQAALPHVHILKERYGVNVLLCAIFYWVCQLMEEPSIHQRTLCQTYSLDPKSFKAIVSTLDKQCDGIADQIKSYLLDKRNGAQAPLPSQPNPKSTPTSPQKSPVKSSLRPRRATRASTPVSTPSKKRTVAFTNLPPEGDRANGDSTPFPETPTKKRRIEKSPRKPSAGRSPVKRPSVDTTAFHAALQGSPAKQPVQEDSSSGAGPSTPHRLRHVRETDITPTQTQTDAQSTPSRSQGQASPTRLARRRFRPVFLEQQQWCARDPKVERMWAAANTVWGEMVEQYGHPFHKREGAMVG